MLIKGYLANIDEGVWEMIGMGKGCARWGGVFDGELNKR